MKFHICIIVLLFVTSLTACGGGGGSSNGASDQTGNQTQPGETVINGKA